MAGSTYQPHDALSDDVCNLTPNKKAIPGHVKPGMALYVSYRRTLGAKRLTSNIAPRVALALPVV